jgi:hypothetical protein
MYGSRVIGEVSAPQWKKRKKDHKDGSKSWSKKSHDCKKW